MVRIEHKKSKIGVFRALNEEGDYFVDIHSKSNKILSRHANMQKFPTFLQDEYLYNTIDRHNIEDYRFAFKSLEHFYSAFEAEEIKEFITLGFEVFYIEATETVESPYQIVFKPENVTIKQTISELFI